MAGTIKMVKSMYCDKPMARSMGLIGDKKLTNMRKCSYNCSSCLACVEVDYDGNKEHVSLSRTSSAEQW